MPHFETTLEIERIRNLISNFDWEIVKQEIRDDEIVLKIKKFKLSSLDNPNGSAAAS